MKESQSEDIGLSEVLVPGLNRMSTIVVLLCCVLPTYHYSKTCPNRTCLGPADLSGLDKFPVYQGFDKKCKCYWHIGRYLDIPLWAYNTDQQESISIDNGR